MADDKALKEFSELEDCIPKHGDLPMDETLNELLSQLDQFSNCDFENIDRNQVLGLLEQFDKHVENLVKGHPDSNAKKLLHLDPEETERIRADVQSIVFRAMANLPDSSKSMSNSSWLRFWRKSQ